MAADERDWYRERAKKTMQDHYYDPKIFRGRSVGSKSNHGKSLVGWVFVATIVFSAAAEWKARGMSIPRLASGVKTMLPENLKEPALVIELTPVGGKLVSSAHMVVGKNNSGQFATTGSLEGSPVVFAIDRSRRETFVPLGAMGVATQQECARLNAATAIVHSQPCEGSVASLVFGVFALPRIRVVFVQSAAKTVSLGEDVMAGFEVEQSDSSMLIRSINFKVESSSK